MGRQAGQGRLAVRSGLEHRIVVGATSGGVTGTQNGILKLVKVSQSAQLPIVQNVSAHRRHQDKQAGRQARCSDRYVGCASSLHPNNFL
jgi:hypothetical protein